MLVSIVETMAFAIHFNYHRCLRRRRCLKVIASLLYWATRHQSFRIIHFRLCQSPCLNCQVSLLHRLS